MNDSEQAWAHIDKSTWPDGPWQHESDKIHWIDRQSDLDCLIVRAPLGALCGYVGVPPDHPCHERDYSEIEVSVHGGLTYAAACQKGGPICHTPASERAENLWWIGFDCSHAWDLAPGMSHILSQHGLSDYGCVYRNIGYVREEVTTLAQQLAALDTRPHSSSHSK